MYKVLVINLEAQPRRWAFMKKQLALLGREIERIPAVNGYDKNNLKHARAASYSFLPDGEIGCFESHRKAWKRIVDDNLPGAFILEDDVAVSSDFNKLAMDGLDLESLDIIKLDMGEWPADYGDVLARLGPERELRRLLGSETSAGCYFLTLSGARKLLEKTGNYYLPVDTMMFNMGSKLFYELRTARVFPAVASQLKYIMAKGDLAPEIADCMQEKRHLGIDPRNEMDLVKRIRLYGRRLMDWDFSAIRKRRMRAHAARNVPAITSRVVPFHTESFSHIDQARVLLDDANPA